MERPQGARSAARQWSSAGDMLTGRIVRNAFNDFEGCSWKQRKVVNECAELMNGENGSIERLKETTPASSHLSQVHRVEQLQQEIDDLKKPDIPC